MLSRSLCLVVLAAPAAAADETLEAAVSRLNALGEEALEADRIADALRSYREAELILSRLPDRRADRARALFLVGHCLEALGRPREALAAFRESLTLDPPSGLAIRLGRRLAKLADSVDGHLVLECPTSATVELEGVEDAPRCGVPYAIAPGQYRARITSAAGDSISLALSIEAGAVLPVRVDFPQATPLTEQRSKTDRHPPGVAVTAEGTGDVAATAARSPGLAWGATFATAGFLVGAGAAEWAARDAAEAFEGAHGRFTEALAASGGMESALAARRDALTARDRFDAASRWRTGLLVASLAAAGVATWAWLDRQPVRLSPTVGGLAVTGAW